MVSQFKTVQCPPQPKGVRKCLRDLGSLPWRTLSKQTPLDTAITSTMNFDTSHSLHICHHSKSWCPQTHMLRRFQRNLQLLQAQSWWPCSAVGATIIYTLDLGNRRILETYRWINSKIHKVSSGERSKSQVNRQTHENYKYKISVVNNIFLWHLADVGRLRSSHCNTEVCANCQCFGDANDCLVPHPAGNSQCLLISNLKELGQRSRKLWDWHSKCAWPVPMTKLFEQWWPKAWSIGCGVNKVNCMLHTI